MQVACPQCRAQLVLDDADAHAGARGLTCVRCGFAFAVNVVATTAASAPTAPALPAAAPAPKVVPVLASAPKTSFQAEQAAGVIGALPTSMQRVDTGTSVVVDPVLQEEQQGSLGQDPSDAGASAGAGNWRRAAMEAVTQEIRVPESLARTPTEQATPPGDEVASALITTPTQTEPTSQAEALRVAGLEARATEPESTQERGETLAGGFELDASGVPRAVLAALGATALRRAPGAVSPQLLERTTAPDASGMTAVRTPPLVASDSGPEQVGASPALGADPAQGTDPEFDLAAGLETDATAELRPEWRREPPRRGRPLGTAMLLLGVAAGSVALFVLARNDWTLDLGRVGPMLTRAFGTAVPANPLLADLRVTGPATELSALADQPRVLLVRGTVENGSPVARAFVYVRAWIERGGVIVASAEAPLDNVFTVAELSRLTARELRGAINPAGRERRNARLGPGEVVPYMVVLTPLPPGPARAGQEVQVAISRVEPVEGRSQAR